MKLHFLLLILFSVGCASVHRGEFAKQYERVDQRARVSAGDIVLSGDEVTSMSSRYFTMLDFTFENISNEWVKVENINVSFLNDELDKNVTVPVGDKLRKWAEAANQVKEVVKYNKELAYSEVTARPESFELQKELGEGKASRRIASITAGAFTYGELRRKLSDVEAANVVPRNHLLVRTIDIPPGLHVKKWMAIQLRQPMSVPYVGKVLISYLANGKKQEYVLDLRDMKSSSSKFQGGYFRMLEKRQRTEDPNWTPY